MSTQSLLRRACAEKVNMVLLSEAEKNCGLNAMANAILDHESDILQANREDMESAKGKISPVMLDRLELSPQRIHAMADGIRALISLPDPTGKVLDTVKRPNGIVIEKTSVSMGVVAIIYESRPNVTADAAALCFKSGNVCVLRTGKEAYRSAHAIVRAMQEGLQNAGFSPNAVQILEDTTHEGAKELMTAVGMVDLLIPRGSARLIQACVKDSLVPCIETGTGICHIYVDKDADVEKALNIIENAKTSRPSVCNAGEVCLVDSAIAKEFLPLLRERLVEKREKNPVELRLDAEAGKIIAGTPATDTDFDTEFLDYILAVKVVDGVKEAVNHIALHSTHHSDGIVTENAKTAEVFLRMVDSAAVYHNASTRFTDGGEFGLGCEMGISTQKLHARGPMGLMELTTYKYIIRGDGQIR